MAEQSPAATAQVFETPVGYLGREGLQLNKPLDDLTMQEVSRIANLYHTGSGLITRLGQTLLASLTGTVHSIRRLNNPRLGTYTRFWGAGTSWYRGASGVPTALDAGFSGNPLTLVPVRPSLSGESWMVAADSSQMRKATASGASLPVGLSAPATPVVVVNAGRRRDVCAFDAGDGTNKASWTSYGAATIPDQAAQQADPTLTDVAGTVGNAVNLESYSSNPPPSGSGLWPEPGPVEGGPG